MDLMGAFVVDALIIHRLFIAEFEGHSKNRTKLYHPINQLRYGGRAIGGTYSSTKSFDPFLKSRVECVINLI